MPGALLIVCLLSVLALAPALADETLPLPDDYCRWQVEDFSIKASLCNLAGDPDRGRRVVMDRHAGNCMACHQLPIPEEPLHGTIGPPLHGVGGRLTEAQLRLRVVDEKQVNPATVMPGYYNDPRRYNRIANDYWRKTVLTAQQVEDVVAWLGTLQ